MRNKTLLITWFKYIIIIGLFIGLDLLTKKLVFSHISSTGKDIVLIEGVLKFLRVENTGASFGMLSDNTKILTYLSLILSIVLFIVLVVTVNYKKPLFTISLMLIIAGGLGNCIDRFIYGYVRDFIYFEIVDYYVFNVADSLLFIGTALLIIFILFGYKPTKTVQKKNA